MSWKNVVPTICGVVLAGVVLFLAAGADSFKLLSGWRQVCQKTAECSVGEWCLEGFCQKKPPCVLAALAKRTAQAVPKATGGRRSAIRQAVVVKALPTSRPAAVNFACPEGQVKIRGICVNRPLWPNAFSPRALRRATPSEAWMPRLFGKNCRTDVYCGRHLRCRLALDKKVCVRIVETRGFACDDDNLSQHRCADGLYCERIEEGKRCLYDRKVKKGGKCLSDRECDKGLCVAGRCNDRIGKKCSTACGCGDYHLECRFVAKSVRKCVREGKEGGRCDFNTHTVCPMGSKCLPVYNEDHTKGDRVVRVFRCTKDFPSRIGDRCDSSDPCRKGICYRPDKNSEGICISPPRPAAKVPPAPWPVVKGNEPANCQSLNEQLQWNRDMMGKGIVAALDYQNDSGLDRVARLRKSQDVGKKFRSYQALWQQVKAANCQTPGLTASPLDDYFFGPGTAGQK